MYITELVLTGKNFPHFFENEFRGLVGILRLGGQYLHEILKFSKKYVLI